MVILSYIQQGGPVLLLILLVSIIGLGVFIERMIYLGSVRKNSLIIKERMREKLTGFRVDEAIGVCENNPGPASNIIKAGLSVYNKSREDIERSMEDASKYELPKLYSNLPILSTIVGISTLLGLLGTVLGMISSTSVLSTEGMRNPSMLIGGISQALITTAAGLMVAIPALVGYNYIVAKTERIISDIEITTTDLIKFLKKDKDTTNTRNW